MIVIPRKQVLLLYVQEPDRVLNAVPSAKPIVLTGRHLVAVPHRLEEVKTLRALGFDAPSPIKYYYDWPGRFSPFHAQKETADFLSTVGNAFVLNDLGCVDADTEYLSETGWQRIADYQTGKVAQYDPKTRAISFVDGEYVKLPCDNMIRLKTKYGVDQLLSPEHRVLLHAYGNPEKTEVLTAEELLRRQDAWLANLKGKKSCSRIGFSQAAIPVTFNAPIGDGIHLTDEELRLQVAVIADGHFPPGSGHRCVVRLKKVRKIDRLRTLLAAAGIQAKERQQPSTGFTIFSFPAPLRLKYFDERFWAATEAQRRVIADEVLCWDGTTIHTTAFFSNVKASADFIQYVFASLGRTARITDDGRGTYAVQIRPNGQPLKLSGTGAFGKLRAVSVAPSTDGYKYCFMVPSTFLLLRRNGCIFATGNTGKTLTVLWVYDYLRRLGLVHRALVVSSLSTLDRVWGDEIFMNFPHLHFNVLHGTRTKREKLLAAPADVYIINHDGVKTTGFVEAMANRSDIDLVIIDEIAQVARNAGAHRWKALNALCNKQTPRRVWGMTGKPTPNAPTDAWAQCRLVNPKSVPPYFNRFRDTVMRQVGPFKWVPRDNALDVVREVMQPAIRFAREDCHDLPPCIMQTRTVEFTDEQKKAYKEMLNTLRTEIDSDEVLAVNEAVKIGKLLQIACGVAYGTDGSTLRLDAAPRIAVLQEIVEEAESKVIVFVPFVGAVEAVSEELRARLPDYEVFTIHGGTSKVERDNTFRSFQSGTPKQVLVAQPAAMAHGLTLTAANTIVWFSAITSNEIYEQANGRIVRPGQKHTQFIINIEGSPVERRLYERLKNKQQMQGLLLELLQGGT